ncbi:MAG: peptidyl-prolyl cis-trans isomerase [Flavobacteriaceae bacterium]|nr:peptidyl-prolyl cis-trans isomerase [Flavobacteriaceae bacterium]
MKIYRLFLIVVFFLIIGCDELNKTRQNQLIARVDNNYLYMSDIDQLKLKFSSASDSIIKIQNYINTWAKNHLFYDKSLLNINVENKNLLDKLVDQYRLDLYNNNYKASIIKAQIDTLITQNQLVEYYTDNNSIFRLKEPLYKYRFIKFHKNNVDRNEITNRFIRYSNMDKVFLDSLSFQFSNSFLNDSIWFTKKTLIQNANFLSSKDLLSIKKSQIFKLEQSNQVYLFKSEDYLPKNEIAPLSFVENTIRNIVFSQRKLEFIKKFDQEIINDAIQNKKFEIYQ